MNLYIPRPFAVACFFVAGFGYAARAHSATTQKATDLKQRLLPSVVYLDFWTPAQGDEASEVAGFGTGFVIVDPNKQKWILTTAHHFIKTPSGKKVSCVRYRASDSSRLGESTWAIVDEQHDLAVLKPDPDYPLRAAPLALLEKDAAIPTPLYALGSSTALDFELYEPDVATAQVFTASKWADKLHVPPDRQADFFRPLSPDVTLLYHGITITPGYSGCPILTKGGEVVGIQSSSLQGAPKISFAIHVKHIRNFNWRKPPVRLEALNLAQWNATGVISQTSSPAVPFDVQKTVAPKAGLPAKIKLAGVDVDAPFIHHGYVERDAVTVIRKYVQDKEWYLKEQDGGARMLRLQELLDRTRLARIDNPLLGLQMLVPEGYCFSAAPTTEPNGLLVTFRPPEGREVSKPYNWPLSVWLTTEPQHFKAGRDVFRERVASGKYPLTPEEQKVPELFAHARDRYLIAYACDVADPRFVRYCLQIGVADDPRSLRINPKSEVFDHNSVSEGTWFRSNYISQTTPLCHNVRMTGRDPLIVLVHYEYTKEDAEAFIRPGAHIDRTFADYTITAASLSVK